MKTLLLVDDSRAVRLATKRMVTPLGVNILEAEDGSQAWNQFQQHPEIDAILLDWNMPVMDGITFLRKLRSDSSQRQPAVIMCTTENDLPRILEAMQAGANEYIMKPFTEEIMREKLAETGVL